MKHRFEQGLANSQVPASPGPKPAGAPPPAPDRTPAPPHRPVQAPPPSPPRPPVRPEPDFPERHDGADQAEELERQQDA